MKRYTKDLSNKRWKPFIEMVEEKIVKNDQNGCFEWVGSLDENGYGKMKVNGKKVRVHRIYYTLKIGEIPDGLCVLHKCDNRKCVNPDHLFLGSLADNNFDRHSKNRSSGAKGEANYKAKLKVKDIIAVRELGGKISHKVIAAQYNLSRSTISRVINKTTWAKV